MTAASSASATPDSRVGRRGSAERANCGDLAIQALDRRHQLTGSRRFGKPHQLLVQAGAARTISSSSAAVMFLIWTVEINYVRTSSSASADQRPGDR